MNRKGRFHARAFQEQVDDDTARLRRTRGPGARRVGALLQLGAAPSAAQFGRSSLPAERVGDNERHQLTTLRRSTTCLTPFVSRASRIA
jgi:hypothetical protein